MVIWWVVSVARDRPGAKGIGGRSSGRAGARGTALGRQREDEANVGEGELQDAGASAPEATSETPWRPFFGTLGKWESFERFGRLKVACSVLGGHRICGKHF